MCTSARELWLIVQHIISRGKGEVIQREKFSGFQGLLQQHPPFICQVQATVITLPITHHGNTCYNKGKKGNER